MSDRDQLREAIAQAVYESDEPIAASRTPLAAAYMGIRRDVYAVADAVLAVLDQQVWQPPVAPQENQRQRMAPWKPSDTIDVYLNGNPGQWDWCLIDNLDPDDCRAIAIESIRRLDAALREAARYEPTLACLKRLADDWTPSATTDNPTMWFYRDVLGDDPRLREPMTEAEQEIMASLYSRVTEGEEG